MKQNDTNHNTHNNANTTCNTNTTGNTNPKLKHLQNYHLIFQLAPNSFIEMIFWSIFNCILSVLNVWATGQIVLLLSYGYSSTMIGLICLYGALLILSAAYSVYYKRYRVQFRVIPAFEQRIRAKLFQKSSMISNEIYEDASAATMIRLADGAKQNLFRYVEIWISILTAILQALVVTMYVSTFNAWFLLLLPFSIIPPCLNLLYQSTLWKRYHIALEQYQKEESAYFKGLIDEVACKESKITYASDLLISKWKESRKQRDSLEQKKATKLFILQMLLIPADFLGSFGGYLISIVLLFFGKIDYAACTAAIAAYASILSALSSLVSMIGYEGQYRKMIQPFFDYLEKEERSTCKDLVSFQKEIRLDHVSFHYPQQERQEKNGKNGNNRNNKKNRNNVLDNINLTIKKGEVIAIVGENGAGKTTLTNIILGLFLPSSGTVYYDETDISSISELELHKKQSVVPQVFARYKMTVRDNITISAFDSSNRSNHFHDSDCFDYSDCSDHVNHADDEKITQANLTFLHDSHLSLDTMLGKEFGGRDLSGGQWQQLSCARGFYKNSEFLVLDEATSAIDPLKEKAMYDSFRRELNGKTGIIITHRLGAVSLADKIVVLEHGHIVQEGTHDELLKEDGLYSQLWKIQANSFLSQSRKLR